MPLTDVDIRTGVCPKCGAKDIRRLGGWGASRHAVFRGLHLDQYVCVACGYLEEYVNRYDLKKVANYWARVPPMDSD
jgi:hypothetical protein